MTHLYCLEASTAPVCESTSQSLEPGLVMIHLYCIVAMTHLYTLQSIVAMTHLYSLAMTHLYSLVAMTHLYCLVASTAPVCESNSQSPEPGLAKDSPVLPCGEYCSCL